LQKKEEEISEVMFTNKNWEKKFGALQGEMDKLRGQLEKKDQGFAKIKETMESQKLALAEKDQRIAQVDF
ncbi:hypothetical protein RFI_33605, partial [Reticulomyxa filosa]